MHLILWIIRRIWTNYRLNTVGRKIKQKSQTVSDINIIVLFDKSSILLDSAESIPRDSSVDCVLNERENSPRVTRNAVEWI